MFQTYTVPARAFAEYVVYHVVQLMHSNGTISRFRRRTAAKLQIDWTEYRQENHEDMASLQRVVCKSSGGKPAWCLAFPHDLRYDLFSFGTLSCSGDVLTEPM